MSEMSDTAGGMLPIWRSVIAYGHPNTMDSARQFVKARMADDSGVTVIDNIAWELYSATTPNAGKQA